MDTAAPEASGDDAGRQQPRMPAVAGSFYPADPGVLRSMLDTALRVAASDVPGDAPTPKALLVPHAGYVYSGTTAALAYDLVARQRGRIRRVVLLGPCHRVWVDGIAESGASHFVTPLGGVGVEQVPTAVRARLPFVQTVPATHAREHSLEVQVPFLQTVLDRFTLLPLVVGGAGPEQVADLLDEVWGGDETLVVVSSDLSHYLPQQQAVDADTRTLDQVLDLDGPVGARQACGAAPLNGLLVAARRHGLTPTLLGRRTSGEPNELNSRVDPQRVVGYAAVSFH